MSAWLDYTINGLIVGNIYALLAVGLALIFGVSHLINFAQGSIYTAGAFIGWTCVTYLHTPLPVTMLIVVAGCALLGVVDRAGRAAAAGRVGADRAAAGDDRHLASCSTRGCSSSSRPTRAPCRTRCPTGASTVGRGTIGALDLLIAATGMVSAAVLFGFLRFSRLGWAVRATAQDSEAARQMGVDTDAVNRTVFAIAAGLGGLSGLLVGMYYNHIDTAMSFQATLKGVVAQVIGGMGNVPGAIGGALLLGLTESFGVGLFGSSYRNLFAFVLLLLMLVLAAERPVRRPPLRAAGAADRHLHRAEPALARAASRWSRLAVAAAALLPLVPGIGYALQVLTNAWLYALLAISLTLVAGTLGQVSLGHAGLLLIGAYASALLALDSGWPVWLSIPAAGLVTAALGTALTWPAFRLRSHYVSIATLGIGEIVGLVILNWESLTRGPMGVIGIPPLSLGPVDLDSPQAAYWAALTVLVAARARRRRGCCGRISAAPSAPSATTTWRRAPTASRSTATRASPSPSAASPPASAARSRRTSIPTSTTRPSRRRSRCWR